LWLLIFMLVTDLVPALEKNSKRLIVVLHGLGDSMEGYRWLPDMLGFPWLNYLLVNAPDEYYGGYSWYDFASNPGPGVERSRRLLFDLLEEQEKRGFAPEQTVLFGFSQGSLMVTDAGLRYPRRFAGLIGISGHVHEPDMLIKELSPVAREQKILMTHGTYDPLIPFGTVRLQVAVLKAAGLQIEWHEFSKEHTIAGEEELDVIRGFIRRQLREQAST
jgi:phospholipase/carboxylesterase